MFAPICILIQNLIGQGKFKQVRGKAIALHTHTITCFCNSVGLNRTTRQNLIRLAHDNGKKLGLLF